MAAKSGRKKSVATDYEWTTGGDVDLVHERLIDTGGFSEVHQVYASADLQLLTVDAENRDKRGGSF